MATNTEITLKTFWTTFGSIILILIAGLIGFSSRMAVLETRQDQNIEKIREIENAIRDINNNIGAINSNMSVIIALEERQAHEMTEIRKKLNQ